MNNFFQALLDLILFILFIREETVRAFLQVRKGETVKGEILRHHTVGMHVSCSMLEALFIREPLQ